MQMLPHSWANQVERDSSRKEEGEELIAVFQEKAFEWNLRTEEKEGIKAKKQRLDREEKRVKRGRKVKVNHQARTLEG